MLKKINVKDVQLGMYIHEICGSWMDNPFWQKSFMLEKEKDLQNLFEYRIKEVWIDTGKGRDITVHTPSVSLDEQKRQVDHALRKIAADMARLKPRVALQQELVCARRVVANAKTRIVSMFSEARMGKAIQMEQAADVVDEINQSIARNPTALLSIVRLKNASNYTYMHSVAVSGLIMALGRELGLDGDLLKQVGIAGLLHDVGKIYIPEHILNKTSQLTTEEFAVMKTHPRRGWELLNQTSDVNAIALDVCLHHHERVDGKGYPEQLSGEALTMFARMGAICDVYDAITSTRCYKASWEPAEALHKMTEWREGHFDDTFFAAFVRTVGIYPSGTLVKLKSGRLAVVIEQTEGHLLRPTVKIFYSTHSKMHLMPELVDLSQSADTIVGREDPQQWGFKLEGLFYGDDVAPVM